MFWLRNKKNNFQISTLIWRPATITLFLQGQPNFVRVYKYPNFGGPNAAVANRTFFKADKVEMMWNKTSSAMLLLTTTETSESSYYGDQGLHFVGMNGESSLVHLGNAWVNVFQDYS